MMSFAAIHQSQFSTFPGMTNVIKQTVPPRFARKRFWTGIPECKSSISKAPGALESPPAPTSDKPHAQSLFLLEHPALRNLQAAEPNEQHISTRAISRIPKKSLLAALATPLPPQIQEGPSSAQKSSKAFAPVLHRLESLLLYKPPTRRNLQAADLSERHAPLLKTVIPPAPQSLPPLHVEEGQGPSNFQKKHILYDGPSTIGRMEQRLERDTYAFQIVLNLRNDSNLAAIEALALLLRSHLERCEKMRINLSADILLNPFLAALRRSSAPILRTLEICRASGCRVIEDDAMHRLTFVEQQPLKHLKLVDINLTALRDVPDVIGLCVTQHLTKLNYDSFFLKLSGLRSLEKLEIRGWTTNESPTITAEKSLNELVNIRVVGSTMPLPMSQSAPGNPLRSLFQQFKAPLLHYAEIQCETFPEAVNALDLFSLPDNLLRQSTTLKHIRLFFLQPRSSSRNALFVHYPKLLNAVPLAQEMRLVTPLEGGMNDTYTVHVCFTNEGVRTKMSLQTGLQYLSITFNDEDSLLDFIEASAPDHLPKNKLVHTKSSDCWKRVSPGFSAKLRNLGLNLVHPSGE
ncbi:hypothetical protein HWV62_44217 [Athelia sp. TMB]|nr:hypothetical protein HWV62_44217 [Athelia sp. TMB]